MHLGKVPYVTESMMPGTNIDASKFIERSPTKNTIFNTISHSESSDRRYVSVSTPNPPHVVPVLHIPHLY